MKKIFAITVIAVMAVMTSGCGKVNDALDRITYLYNDSMLTGMSNDDIFKLDESLWDEARGAKNNLKLELARVFNNLDYTYQSKQTEMLSLMDVIITEYNNKYLQGKIVLQSSVPSSNGSHTVKTWALHYGNFSK